MSILPKQDMIADYQAEVLENKQLNETVFETTLKLDKPMIWEPGQYISLEVRSPESVVRRSYSICSDPNDPNISICVDTKFGGPGSVFIKNLRIGDKVNFKGPLGNFKIVSDSPSVFVATGTGIAPFKAMIPTVHSKVKLLWGLRHKSEAYYQDFFDKFDCQMVYSEDGYHVTDYLKNLTGEIYLCGNMNMIKDVLKIYPNAHFESFFGG